MQKKEYDDGIWSWYEATPLHESYGSYVWIKMKFMFNALHTLKKWKEMCPLAKQ